MCSVGEYMLDGVCEPCEEGFYQDEQGQTSCKPCPLGQTTHIAGVMSLAECTGTYLECDFGLRCMSKPPCFSTIFYKGKQVLWHHFCFHGRGRPSGGGGSILKRKLGQEDMSHTKMIVDLFLVFELCPFDFFSRICFRLA